MAPLLVLGLVAFVLAVDVLALALGRSAARGDELWALAREDERRPA